MGIWRFSGNVDDSRADVRREVLRHVGFETYLTICTEARFERRVSLDNLEHSIG